MLRAWTDDCGRVVQIQNAPQRIVCLCPSLTETLFDLGLGERIVGRTRYCIHPADAVSSVTVVGGTKQIDMAAMLALQPDLIIGEKEENRREDVDMLAAHWPVYVCDIQNIEQAWSAIAKLGEVTGVTQAANQMVAEIRQRWAVVAPPDQQLPKTRVLYLIWRKPWMAAGRNTYIDSVLDRLGLHNVALDLPDRYPQIAPADLAAMNIDLCLLSSEPYPFKAPHQKELQAIWPHTRIELVDGEMFSWYGSRMSSAADYLCSLQKRMLST